MKYSIKGLWVVGAVLLCSSLANAATTQTVNAIANIVSVADLSIAIFEGQNVCGPGGSNCYSAPTGANVAPNMNFGTLTYDTVFGYPSTMGADKYFLVYLSTNTSSRPYTIKATMSPFSNGSVELPKQASAAVIYASLNNADIPGDSYSSAPVSAVMNDQTIYTSSASGSSATVQALYAIPKTGSAAFSGAEMILASQQGGTYTATLTFSLVIS